MLIATQVLGHQGANYYPYVTSPDIRFLCFLVKNVFFCNAFIIDVINITIYTAYYIVINKSSVNKRQRIFLKIRDGVNM